MDQGNRVLSLFPLNTVLFPHAVMPLRIFEDRYKLMLQRCLDADSKFGVVLIKSGVEVGGPAETYLVGTMARIIDVQRSDNEQILITVVGDERFRIETLTQDLPYLEGHVSSVAEDLGPTISQNELEEVRVVAAEQVRLVHGLVGGWVSAPALPTDPVVLSYFIAAMLQVGVGEKQAILEELSVAERFKMELRILERDREALEERVARELGGGNS